LEIDTHKVTFLLDEILPVFEHHLRKTPTDPSSLIDQINRGDCGLFSLCLGSGLEAMGETVTYIEVNGQFRGHAFVKWGDKYFDSVNPEGLDSLEKSKFWKEDMRVSEQDYETQKRSWVHETDDLGLAILNDWKEVLRTLNE
tara:strand:- start:45883 stop:46308 length:426 start_codon:yes stop_codon:yes gene_type:complete